jgi:hypothetical protein
LEEMAEVAAVKLEATRPWNPCWNEWNSIGNGHMVIWWYSGDLMVISWWFNGDLMVI